MVVVFVHLLIELVCISNKPSPKRHDTYQIKYRHLHHTLVEVGCPVFYYFYRNYFLCS